MKSICMSGQTAGYGLIKVSEADFEAAHKFSIQRGSDKKFLAVQGWQDTEEFLTPLNKTMHEGNLILEIGPKVVDSLDSLEAYRFSLEGLGSKSTLVVESLVYSQLAGSGAVEETPFTVQPERDSELHEPLPLPVEDSVAEDFVAPSPVEQDEPKLDALHMADKAPSAKRNWWWLAVVLLLLLGGGGWYFWQKSSQIEPVVAQSNSGLASSDQAKSDQAKLEQSSSDQGKPEQANPDQSKPDQATDKPALTPASSEPDSQPAPAKPTEQAGSKTSAKAMVIEFMRAGGTAKAAWVLSQSLVSDPKVSEANSLAGQDAQFLLIEYAAEGGEPEAMQALAKIYDPNNSVKHGSIIKDADQAKFWYEKAQQAGADVKQVAPKQ